MKRALDQHVRRRAANRCEYCHVPQSSSTLRFPIDHIIAKKHKGKTVAENLALCCGHCNGHKGSDIAGLDPRTGRLTRLFNPRTDMWADHFRRVGAAILGTTAIGRATVEVLTMNDPDELGFREHLLSEGILDAG